LTFALSFDTNETDDTGAEEKTIKSQNCCCPQDELGQVPKQEEIERVFLLTRVMYKAVLGLHFKRQEQKKTGQLAIF
jgi:hypothetical protein